MDEDELQRLHARLLDGDPTATRDLVRFVDTSAPRLLTQLRRKWPGAARELCEEAVLEALFNYLNAPGVYDPARGRLERYLFWSAHRDLQNLIERERHQRPPNTRSLDVELGAAGRKWTLAERVADPRADPDHWLDEIDPRLLARIAAALPDEQDRRVFALIVAGERHTAAFASLLGLAHLAHDEQRQLVKRVKDRVLARVRRRVERNDDE